MNDYQKDDLQFVGAFAAIATAALVIYSVAVLVTIKLLGLG